MFEKLSSYRTIATIVCHRPKTKKNRQMQLVRHFCIAKHEDI